MTIAATAKEMTMSRIHACMSNQKGRRGDPIRGRKGVTALGAAAGVGEARRSRFRTLHQVGKEWVGKEFGQGGGFFRSCITKAGMRTT